MKRVVSALAVAAAFAAISTAASSQNLSAQPPRPTEFAAPETDRAGVVARQIAALIHTFPNLRASSILGQWRHDERAVWTVRPERVCLDELAALGIEATPYTAIPTQIPTAVRLGNGLIGGVTYRKYRAHPFFIISCELAVRLVHLSEVLRAHGIDTVDVVSAWRRFPWTSFHTMGLALDILGFHGPAGDFEVLTDYPSARSRTCPAPEGAAFLQRLACDINASGRFSTMITPSYSAGHRNHFHIDTRPDDPRTFVR